MSNIATLVMEGTYSGGSFGGSSKKYSHENGAAQIAMESADALQSIFESEFYIPNSLVIEATLEGYSSVEDSPKAALMEASIKDVFAKIIAFFKKLKDAVIKFFYNVKRYLLGIFGDSEKWVKTYKKDIKALKSDELDGYEVKMFEYKEDLMDIDKLTKVSGVEIDAEATLKSYGSTVAGTMETDFDKIKEAFDNQAETYKRGLDIIYKTYVKEVLGCEEDDDFTEECWSLIRSGATGEEDKESIEVYPNIDKFIDWVSNSKKNVDKMGKLISNASSAYDKVIKKVESKSKEVETAELKTKTDNDKKIEKLKNECMAKKLKINADLLSKKQGVVNTLITGVKTALVERDKAAKKALLGTFQYARQQNRINKRANS